MTLIKTKVVGIGIHVYGLINTNWWTNTYNIYRSGLFQFCFFDNCKEYSDTSSFGNNFNVSKSLLIAGKQSNFFNNNTHIYFIYNF